MRFRIGLVVGVGIGYVLGTRAGRERYEQIRRAAQNLSSNPSVQQAAGRVQAQATQLGSQARRMMQERTGAMGQDLADKVGAKLPGRMGHLVSTRFGHQTIDLDAESAPADGMSEQAANGMAEQQYEQQ